LVPNAYRLRFVAISDTHGRHGRLKLPKGDVLLHAGDISYRGDRLEVIDFLNWFRKQDYAHKILIGGNHDFFLERAKGKELADVIPPNVTYLNDSGTVLNGISIWGSPITPKFFNWAFNRKRGAEVKKHWAMIPADTRLLITHGPPFGILDQTAQEQRVGCKDLLRTIQAIRPEVHLFGHIHEGYGTTKDFGIRFINASQMNESYEMVNKPIVFELS
jgi:Icc-related predicted phosphoesterase